MLIHPVCCGTRRSSGSRDQPLWDPGPQQQAPSPPSSRGCSRGSAGAGSSPGGSSWPWLLCAPSRAQPGFRGCAAPSQGPCPGQLLVPRIAQISCRGSNNCPRDGKHQLFSAFWEHCWARGEQSQGKPGTAGQPSSRKGLQLVMIFRGLVFPKKGKGFQEVLNLRLAFSKQFSRLRGCSFTPEK